MNRHSLTFYGPPSPLHQQQRKGHPIATRSPRGRISPPKASSPLIDSEVPARCKEQLENLGLPVMKGAIAREEAQQQLDDQVAEEKDEPGTFSRMDLETETTDDKPDNQVLTIPLTVTRDSSLSATDSTASAALSTSMRRRNSSHASPPPTPIAEGLSSSHSNDSVLTPGKQQRRRASRKSVSGLGLVIECDLDDESDCTLFAGCDDYEDINWRPGFNRQDSTQSLEELRTRLEALEHERPQGQLPEHDKTGLGEVCVNKQFMEALESSSNNIHALDGTYCSLAYMRNSFGTSQGCSPLLGIPAEGFESDDDNADGDDDAEVQHSSIKVQRRSTARLSIHGLVMEYDWSSASEEEQDEHDAQQEN
jgi:hypothetical protein